MEYYSVETVHIPRNFPDNITLVYNQILNINKILLNL